MRYCTAINCMDGRVQEPVTAYLRARFGAELVDVVSAAGPNRILAEGTDTLGLKSIERRVRLSLEKHASVGIAIVGHHDCAGNPTPETEQAEYTKAAVSRIRVMFPDVPVIGLWVNKDWQVSELD
ncbi:MAG: hypothetical protein KJ626_09170 [Verrucomicrobia bacterium]|nr:hypothetical protein [Verrucomicrobiota bacterium]